MISVPKIIFVFLTFYDHFLKFLIPLWLLSLHEAFCSRVISCKQETMSTWDCKRLRKQLDYVQGLEQNWSSAKLARHKRRSEKEKKNVAFGLECHQATKIRKISWIFMKLTLYVGQNFCLTSSTHSDMGLNSSKLIPKKKQHIAAGP